MACASAEVGMRAAVAAADPAMAAEAASVALVVAAVIAAVPATTLAGAATTTPAAYEPTLELACAKACVAANETMSAVKNTPRDARGEAGDTSY